jgi:hypothetical protein
MPTPSRRPATPTPVVVALVVLAVGVSPAAATVAGTPTHTPGFTAGPTQQATADHNTTPDTTPPTIMDFRATNPDGTTVRVAITADEPIVNATVSVVPLDGDVVSTRSVSSLTAANGTYTFSYEADRETTYDVSLREATDAAGNDGAGGQTDAVTVGNATDPAGGPESLAVVFEAGPGGLGSYELVVATNGTPVTAIDRPQAVTNGSSTGVGTDRVVVRGDHPETGPTRNVTLLTAELDGPVDPARLSVTVRSLADDDGRSLPADRVRVYPGASPFWDVTAGPIQGFVTPRSVDADTLVEDFTGDGRFTFRDVVAFVFELDTLRDASLEPRKRRALDHSGDGRVSFLDVIDLVFDLPNAGRGSGAI